MGPSWSIIWLVILSHLDVSNPSADFTLSSMLPPPDKGFRNTLIASVAEGFISIFPNSSSF